MGPYGQHRRGRQRRGRVRGRRGRVAHTQSSRGTPLLAHPGGRCHRQGGWPHSDPIRSASHASMLRRKTRPPTHLSRTSFPAREHDIQHPEHPLKPMELGDDGDVAVGLAAYLQVGLVRTRAIMGLSVCVCACVIAFASRGAVSCYLGSSGGGAWDADGVCRRRRRLSQLRDPPHHRNQHPHS